MKLDQFLDFKAVIEDKSVRLKDTIVQIDPGSCIAFTGKMAKQRADLVRLSKGYGFKVHESVTSNTNFLVVPDNSDMNSTKAVRAHKLGTKVITESQFLQSIGEL